MKRPLSPAWKWAAVLNVSSVLAVALAACGGNATSVDKLPGTAPLPGPTATVPTSPGNAGPVRRGQWGGDHIAMTVTDIGATIQLDCAHAMIEQAVRAGPNGFFTQTGTYSLEGGPQLASPRPGFVASFYGAADSNSMQMTVTYRDDGGQTVSNFYVLNFGQPANLTRCQ